MPTEPSGPRAETWPGQVLPGGRPGREAGFTLVELMVAMTLFLVLAAVVLSAIVTMAKALTGSG